MIHFVHRLTLRQSLYAVGLLLILPFCKTGLLAVAEGAENPWLAPPRPDTNLPVLTTIRQVRDLSNDQANKQYPVSVTAVVTYFDPFWRTLFIQDDTAGTWVYRTFQETNLYAGDLLQVTGASSAIFGPAIKPSSVKILGKAPLPKPRLVTYEAMASGHADAQRIQTQGVIRRMAYRDGLLEFDLAAGNDHVPVYLPRFEHCPLPTNLLGARVEVPGVCSLKLDQQGLITGLWFYVADLESITVLRPAAADPYKEPTHPINALLKYDTWASFGERVKVAGVVTHSVLPGRLFLRDETRSVSVDLMQPWERTDRKGRYLDPPIFPPLQPGDQIEVVGYRSVLDGQFSIVDAEFRLVGHERTPEAQPVGPEAALNPDLDGELVSLEGRLIETESRPAGKATNLVLSLLSRDTLFEAELMNPGGAPFKAHKNSLVRVTGVNSVQTDPWRRARFFRLLLRTREDVKVLQATPFWSLRVAARIVAVGAFVILASFVWILLLRREVAHTTAGLRHANERLEELNASKSRFISMVTHEIRTPLALILSSEEILERYLDRLSSEKRQRHLETIRHSVARMALLVEDVLMFNRAEAGRLEFRPEPVELTTFCRQLVDQVHSATSLRCPIRLNIAECNGSVRVDETLLQHILMNLLANAVKFSNAGEEVLLDVDVQPHQAIFKVQDRGIGIPAADRNRIFEPFYRARNAARIAGTGLGLVIVKRCVERHGGSLEIESYEGSGTRFTVRVPIYTPGGTELHARNEAPIKQPS